MSLGYYQGKIPEDLKDIVYASETNRGYWIGNTKIADLGASSSEIRAAVDRHAQNERLIQTRLLIAELDELIISTYNSKINEANRQLSVVDTASQKAESLGKGLNAELSKVGDIKELSKAKQNIENKINRITFDIRSEVGAQRDRIVGAINTLQSTMNKKDNHRDADVYAQYSRYQGIYNVIRNTNVYSNATIIQKNIVKMRDVSDNVSALKQLFSTFTDVANQLKSVKSKIVEDFLTRLSNLISDADIESKTSVANACLQSKGLYEKLRVELSVAKEVSKTLAERQKIALAINGLARAGESLTTLDVPEYQADCLTFSALINDELDDLANTKSELIRNRINSIKSNIDAITKKDSYDRNDYDELTVYKREIEQIKADNEQYEEFKSRFDTIVKQINDCQSFLGENKTEYVFDQANFETLEKNLAEELAVYQKRRVMKLYEYNLEKSRDLMMNELKFRCMQKEGKGNVKEINSSERYTQEVFYSEENPMVVAVVTSMKNGEQFIQSRPVCLNIDGTYYFLNRTEKTAALVHQVCNTIHGASDSVQIDLSPDELDYYLIEGEEAKRYAAEMSLFKSNTVRAIQRSQKGNEFARDVFSCIGKSDVNVVAANKVANVGNLQKQKARALTIK